ncbi:MAG: helix-hairpin-helix domain-containing protein [Candidatus Nanopelagicales bacterium]
MSRNADLITARLAALAAEWTPPALAEWDPEPSAQGQEAPGAEGVRGRRLAASESLDARHAALDDDYSLASDYDTELADPDLFDDGLGPAAPVLLEVRSTAATAARPPDPGAGRSRVGRSRLSPGVEPGYLEDQTVLVGASDVAGRPARPVLTRAVTLVLLVLLLLIVSLGVFGLRSRPKDVAVTPVTVSGTPAGLASVAPSASAAQPSGAPTTIVIHVAGKVRSPGLVELPAGSRVADALEAAGGLRKGAKLGETNLAEQVVDGQRIDIGVSTAVSSGGGSGGQAAGGGAAGASQLVNLNTATLEELDTLPGVGPVTAGKILAWRAANGRFATVEELAEVPGIGPKTLAELRPLVRV